MGGVYIIILYYSAPLLRGSLGHQGSFTIMFLGHVLFERSDVMEKMMRGVNQAEEIAEKVQKGGFPMQQFLPQVVGSFLAVQNIIPQLLRQKV